MHVLSGNHDELSMKNIPVGRRRTAQREAISKVIRAAHGPLTIEQIYQRARRGSRNLGVATVYRTVNLLLESRRIHTVIMPDGEKRYESADLEHHHHFRCRKCEHVYDLPGCPLSIPNGTTLPDGFCVDGHELTLFGTCPNCTLITKRH